MEETVLVSVSGLDPVCLVFGYPQKILKEIQSLQRPFFLFKFLSSLRQKQKYLLC